jgi:8-oxo-dGTP diphosphatase
MASDDKSGIIDAAGGLLWRRCQAGYEIAVVHRKPKRHDDWTLPKGKRNDRESLRDTALREVEEETGYRAAILDYAGAIAYEDKGQVKLVQFWHMMARGHVPEKIDHSEIDDIRWMRAQDAVKILEHPLERALLDVSSRHLRLPPRRFSLARFRERFASLSLDRLRNTVPIVDSDLTEDIEQADKSKAGPLLGWKARSAGLLEVAREASDDGNAERGWRCLKAADRWRLYGLDTEGLRIEIGPILAEANDENTALSKWRKASILKLLCESDGKPKQEPKARDVVRARRILDEYHDNVYQRMAILRRRLWLLTFASCIALAAWLFLLPISPPPISAATGSSPRMGWLGIILSGILGALFSGFSLSIAADPKKSRIPAELSASAVNFARLSMGAVAALGVSIFLASGVLSFPRPGYELMLAAAFVSGFSDRLLMRGIESLTK